MILNEDKNEKRNIADARGHGALLTAAAWAAIFATSMADAYPRWSPVFFFALLVVLLVLSNVARRL
jgi:hypothetical protein